MITLASGRKIGAGLPPFVVAEIGSNWRTFDEAKDSISAAKACGADAVKFQLFGPRDLHGMIEGEPTAWAQGMSVDVSGLVGMSPYLDPAWLPKLKAKADACGIEFMCSAFSSELVAAVDPYVNVHKIASAEMTHVRILEAVRKTGKPVILSTGASGEADILAALEVLKGAQVILLYCVANYPAQAVDPRVIPLMAKQYGMPVGFSDHSVDILTIPKAAADHGACVIEKHVNFCELTDTPDAPHSLLGDQFMLMVRNLKGDYPPNIGTHSEEVGMVLRHNRRLLATTDIGVGQTLQEGNNFGIYRSLKDEHHAYSPFMINEVAGRSAKRAIKAGDGIGPGDV